MEYATGGEPMEPFFLAALQMTPGIGTAQLSKLLAAFGAADRIWQAAPGEIRASGCLTLRAANELNDFIRTRQDLPERIRESCEQKNILVCTMKDAVYPILLKQIFHPPLVLFYRGRLQADVCRLAVVGARRNSAYGRGVAEMLAAGLAAKGITVVSGAARGIDTAAHQGALKEGRTVAVLGCGVDVAYPPENRRLLEEIAERGVVLSEYAPGTQPVAGFFPARNRMISGLSQGTLVIEAAERSGSLITAELALSEGRDVFAVPGSIFSNMSQGCHRLIQQGAKLVTCVEDILDEYSWAVSEKAADRESGAALAMTEEEAAVFALLSFEQPLSIDEIIYKLQGANAANVAFILLQMELKGLIRGDASHAYVRVVSV